MNNLFYDTVTADKVRRTADGYLVAEAKVARTGIQIYGGSEVGRPDMPIVRVYRSPAEVFSDATLKSFAHRPMTNDHPEDMVNSDNWKDLAVGYTAGEVAHDKQFVSVPLTLMDGAAIADYEAGKRELSMGYFADLEFTPGTTPEGEHYDAVQKNIRNNHLALVSRARGGDQLRIGDNNHEDKTMTDAVKTQTVMVDGLPVVTTDAGAQAISKLTQALTDSKAAHEKELATRDAELAKKDATIAELQGKVISDADLDKRVAERAELIADAKTVFDADYAGKSADEIRKAAVVGATKDSALAAKPQAYIDARFDIMLDAAKQDPVKKALADAAGNKQTPVTDNGFGDYLKSFVRPDAGGAH